MTGNALWGDYCMPLVNCETKLKAFNYTRSAVIPQKCTACHVLLVLKKVMEFVLRTGEQRNRALDFVEIANAYVCLGFFIAPQIYISVQNSEPISL